MILMLVVDASVAVKFVAQEPGTEQANTLIAAGQALIAPDWMLIEVAEALRKKAWAKQLLPADAHAALEVLPQLFDRFDPAMPLVAATQNLAFELDHATYDCLYLALAVREGIPMITADRKFWNAAKRADLGHHVQLLTWPGEGD